MSVQAFAYAQARLQSRHAQRPVDSDWRQLQAVGDAVHFLQVARRTRLRRWVLGLQGEQDSHRLELLLRRQFQDYIDEVLHWLPPPWNRSGDWLKRLPELPAIHYLLRGGQSLPWMRNDPRLAGFTGEEHEQRTAALLDSDCAPLVEAWQRGDPLVTAWFEQFYRLVGVERACSGGLQALGGLLQRALLQAPGDEAGEPGVDTDRLSARLGTLFRRQAFRPAACYAHLALTAIDLLTLRGELLQRVLLPGRGGAAA